MVKLWQQRGARKKDTCVRARVCVHSEIDKNITVVQDLIMYVGPLSALPFLNAESNMATSPRRLLLLTSICFQA